MLPFHSFYPDFSLLKSFPVITTQNSDAGTAARGPGAEMKQKLGSPGWLSRRAVLTQTFSDSAVL